MTDPGPVQKKPLGAATTAARHKACMEKSKELGYETSVAEIERRYLSITRRLESLVGLENPQDHTDLTYQDMRLFLDVSRRWRKILESRGLGLTEEMAPEMRPLARTLAKILKRT